MKNLVFLMLFGCFSANLFAQDTQREQIDKTIRAYFEGYMTGNIEKLSFAFDTTSAHLYAPKVEDNKIVVVPNKLGEVVKRWVKNAQNKPYSEADIKQSYYKILLLDVTDDKAAIVDYLSLYKVGEQWKIVSKTFAQK
jgi:hypothetical protein